MHCDASCSTKGRLPAPTGPSSGILAAAHHHRAGDDVYEFSQRGTKPANVCPHSQSRQSRNRGRCTGPSRDTHVGRGTCPECSRHSCGRQRIDERLRVMRCANDFLTADALTGPTGEHRPTDFRAPLAQYLEAHLSCPVDQGGVATLLSSIRSGNFSAVTSLAPQCSFTNSTWPLAFESAAQQVAQRARTELSRFHVCNNDALLQLSLIERFRAGERRPTCDVNSTLCTGPLFFYEPTSEPHRQATQ